MIVSFWDAGTSPYATAGGVVIEHSLAVLPGDVGGRMRHLTDNALELDRAARLVELINHRAAALVHDLDARS